MPGFQGFHPLDFDQLAGSRWRNRDSLGGDLAEMLAAQLGRPYESWGARRRLELHLADRDHYNADYPDRCAKLFVYTHNLHTEVDELAFGFYVESPPAGGDSALMYADWLRFRDRLRDTPAMQTALLAAMSNHKLVVSDYYRAEEDGGAIGGKFTFRDGGLQKWQPLGESWADVTPDQLIHQLSLLPDHDKPVEWLHLHVYSRLSRPTAIEMGQGVVAPIMAVLRSLAPVYEMTVAGSTRGGGS